MSLCSKAHLSARTSSLLHSTQKALELFATIIIAIGETVLLLKNLGVIKP